MNYKLIFTSVLIAVSQMACNDTSETAMNADNVNETLEEQTISKATQSPNPFSATEQAPIESNQVEEAPVDVNTAGGVLDQLISDDSDGDPEEEEGDALGKQIMEEFEAERVPYDGRFNTNAADAVAEALELVTGSRDVSDSTLAPTELEGGDGVISKHDGMAVKADPNEVDEMGDMAEMQDSQY